MSAKCPGCGAAKNKQRTIALRGSRPRGEDTSGCVVWRCGRNTISNEPTPACVDRQLAQRDARIARLEETCRQALRWIEGDEATHGRQFGTGNALRAALAQEATP